MFGKLFKPKPTDFIAPFDGKLMTIEEVPDPVFSNKTMGDGFAIEMYSGDVFSPCDGEVVALFPTGHAIGIKSTDRNEYLIHLGLETVNYKGDGFTSFIKLGDKVKKGDLLTQVDVNFFKKNGVCLISPIIVTNANQRKIKLLKNGEIRAKEENIIAIVP